MFHVRQLITQNNLSILKYSRNSLIRFDKNLSTTKKPTDTQKIDFEHIIRIDHTEPDLQIKLSESCIKRLKELGLTEKYLRITVDSGGCSGFEYKFSIDNISEGDKLIEQENCKVIVDEETESFIKGSTIDYYEELIKSGFRIIDNPNSEQACSCGSSFSPKI